MLMNAMHPMHMLAVLRMRAMTMHTHGVPYN